MPAAGHCEDHVMKIRQLVSYDKRWGAGARLPNTLDLAYWQRFDKSQDGCIVGRDGILAVRFAHV